MVDQHPHTSDDPSQTLDPWPHPDPSQFAFTPGTYIVQVPKDQIYRLPPSGNAQIAGRLRNGAADNIKRRTLRRCCLLICCIVLFSILVIVGFSLGIAFLCFNPTKPIFQVKHLSMDDIEKASSRPRLRVKVNVENPNGDTLFTYEKDGSTAISYRNQEICAGSFPSFRQDSGDSRRVGVVFNVCGRDLPVDDVGNCRKRKKERAEKEVCLDVSIDLSVIARKGILVRHLKIFAVCQLVVGSLCNEDSRIISQNCETKG